MRIDTRSRSEQVADYLRKYVSRGRLSPGDQLPSESDMARELGISRNSVREAYISLERDAFIIRKHGIGTFLLRSPIVTNRLHTPFRSYLQTISAAGHRPTIRDTSVAVLNAPEDVRKALEMTEQTDILSIARLIHADEHPAVHVRDYFSPEFGTDLRPWESFDGDMLKFMASFFGTKEFLYRTKIQPVLADEELAVRLKLPLSAPVILEKTTVFMVANNAPIVYTTSYLNVSVMELEVTGIVRTGR